MSNDSILREVDEELRGDRMRNLWRRFGPWIIIAAVAIVLAVAVNEGWSWWQRSTTAQASDTFYSALELAEQGDVPGAISALDAIEATGASGYQTLARFREAALLARDGRRDEAVAAYDALSTSVTEPRVRELAFVLAASLLVDGGDVSAVRQRIGGLEAPDNPLRNVAREIVGLTQYASGEIDGSLETFEALLADPLVNQDLAGRVQIYVMQLLAEGAGNPEQRAAAEAAAAGAAEAGAAAEATDLPPQPSVTELAPLLPPAVDVPAAPVPETAEPVAQTGPAADTIVPEVPQAPANAGASPTNAN
ncbi:hypothetical protein SAMN02983003_0568 [Devosia enhydra]|uniref:Ancillary SecYEG translocon subunit/Cell division coordinator CpoB TPR domain-containing protein n=1 Tax=Devosia enhydra TaxID=665118 RepID=A0A1K2HTK0_9HYPH|nr:tetratricopeptide repeat protein [Devosia enhydra]SFZ81567.1 hypothetical protein SAMN02983003_0568 [Devosia enhydra]